MSGAELAALRAFAIDRGGRIAAHLGTSVATGSIRDVPMPTAEGLPGLVREYAPEARATADLVEDGVDPDQAVIEQFASPFMDFGAKSVALGNQPEDFLVRAGLGAIGAAAALVAAIDHRPPYRHAD